MVTFKVKMQWTDTKQLHLIGTLAFTGSYTTGGDTINFGLLSADTYPVLVKSGSAQLYQDQEGQSIYAYKTVYGTTINNGKIKIISAGAELSAGAYPGGITGDTVTFYAIFNKFQ